MGIRTKITDKGVISFQTTSGDTAGNKGFTQGSDHTPPTLAANSTLTAKDAGSYVVSAGGVVTTTLPDPSLCPGSRWVFRAGSAHAHVLTGSFSTGTPFTDGTDHGGQVAIDNVAGSSVVLMADGANYLVLANSGTLAIS